MPLQVTPQSLQQLNGLDPLYWPQERQWLSRGGQMDESTLAETLAKAEHERKLRPIDFQQREATLNQTLLGNDSKKLENQQKQFEIDYYVNNQAKIDAAKLAKLLGEADDAESKMFYSRIERAMVNGDPKAKALWENFPDQLKAKLQHGYRVAEQNNNTAGQLRIIQERARLDAEKRAQLEELKARLRRDFPPVGASKETFENAAVRLRKEAAAETDAEKKQMLLMEAYDMEQRALQKATAPAVVRGSTDAALLGTEPPQTPKPIVAPPSGSPPANSAVTTRPERQNAAKRITATNPQTGEKIYSDDGGKTWQKL